MNADDKYGAPSALFFLNSAGGTSKTFVENIVIKKVRLKRKVALAVASLGIAVTLF